MPQTDPSEPLLSAARRRLFVAIVALFAGVATLAGAEAMLRFHYRDIARITGATEWETASFEGLTYHWDAYHPRYGWTNQPGYRSDARIPFRVTINAQGLRAPRDYAAQPPEGVQRIAFFGDSMAFGEEVDDGETVPAFLERELAGSEVLNFGVHGYGLGQMLLRMEDEALRYQPDRIVLMLMLPEDLNRDRRPHFVHAKPVFRAPDGELVVGNLPVPIASGQPWLYRHSFAAAWLFARQQVWEAPGDGDAGAVARLLLQRLAKWVDAEGVPLTIVLITNAHDLQRMQKQPVHRQWLDSARALVTDTGLDVLDLSEFLEARWIVEGRALQMPGWHWSPRGNCLIAERIAGHLEGRAPPETAHERVEACPAGKPSP
jgi:hypothetical protein